VERVAAVSVDLVHPSHCPAYGCGPDEHGNVVHRGPGVTLAAPDSDPDRLVTLTPVRTDEVDRNGRQVEYPTEWVMALGATEVVLSGAEAARVFGEGARLVRSVQERAS